MPPQTISYPGRRRTHDEKLSVDLCDLVSAHRSRYRWLVAVHQHTDCTVIAPCPSRESQAAAKKWRTERFCIKWRVSVVGYETVRALNQRAGGRESSGNTSVWSANEGLRRTGGTRRSRFPFERGGQKRDQLARRLITQASVREVFERYVASEVISRIDVWGPRLRWDITFEVAGLMEEPTCVLLGLCEESHRTKGTPWVWIKADWWTSC